MPLYELVMICRMGESSALANSLKSVSTMILENGGVVRQVNNLGDRVLTKNYKSRDGISYGVGRWIQVSREAQLLIFLSLMCFFSSNSTEAHRLGP